MTTPAAAVRAETIPEAVPIQNLYYLLSYAWDFLKQGEPIPLPAGECPNLANLFALILARGIRHEIRKGIHREYVDVTGETPRLRGRLLIRDSMRRQTWLNGRMVCGYDELSHDVLPNRIIVATGKRLLADPSLTPDNASLLRDQLQWLAGVFPIRISSQHFRQVQVRRRNRTFRFLLHICELLHQLRLPGEGTATGRDPLLRSILRDEIVMCNLFERFVRNFYSQHLAGCRVRANWIRWDGQGVDEISQSSLPGLHTDITIDGPGARIIIDCKFHKNALAGGSMQEKASGAHLFQILAYLRNARKTFSDWSVGSPPRGILLYPAVQRSFDFRYKLTGYDIHAGTVDLDRPWQEIHDRLLRIVEE